MRRRRLNLNRTRTTRMPRRRFALFPGLHDLGCDRTQRVQDLACRRELGDERGMPEREQLCRGVHAWYRVCA